MFKLNPRNNGLYQFTFVLIFSISLSGCTGCKDSVYDINPDFANGTVNGSASPAGIIVSLGGDANTLYAVSCNAGIWRSRSSKERAGLGLPWVQLYKSPAKAYSIAVDPNNHNHIAAGERDGDGRIPANNNCGVWESFDEGTTWPVANYFNPRTLAGCGSQAVPAVAFSSRSTLFIATSCGIGVKQSAASTFTFPALPGGITMISALAVSETKVWARTPNGTLLVSTNDGTSFDLATNVAAPAAAVFGATGDATTLAAFDDFAFMSTVGDDNGVGNNYCQILIFDVANDKWIFQTRVNNTLNGTGIGGRRQVKSYITGNDGKIGSGRQLYFNAGQNIFRATKQKDDKTLEWENLISTTAGDATDLKNSNLIHSEIWDFLPAPDRSSIWIATDGGVFESTTAIPGPVMRSSGLHTQHIHDLFTPDPDLHLAYPTHDNDAWFRTAPGIWSNENSLGDVTWVGGNACNPVAALLVRQTGKCDDGCSCTLLTGFGTNLPSGTPLQCITLNNDASFDNNKPAFVKFIQTAKDVPPPGSPLDAVMLTKLPLQFVDAGGKLTNVKGPLGNPASNGTQAVVLIRNKQFIQLPDINISKGAGWELIADNLPDGTIGFWVTGGHNSPIAYVVAVQSGIARLFKASSLQKKSSPTNWQELNVAGSVLDPTPWPASGIIPGGLHGPVYVNPYNSYQVYVLTTRGVRYSTDGGFSFHDDTELTKLITGSGKFSLVGNFTGGNSFNVDIADAYGSVKLATLSDMRWNREKPNEVAACSPFTGVFYSNQIGKWRDVGSNLPLPFTAISSVGITDNSIFVATEGRGLLEIRDFH